LAQIAALGVPSDADQLLQKLRKTAKGQPSAAPSYTAPDDLPSKITELPSGRQGPAKALLKSLTHTINNLDKKGNYTAYNGMAPQDCAELFALQIERAVHDTHGTQGAYTSQIRTLAFNLKGNPELCPRLLSGDLTPTILATMATEELASEELQKETAEMKARAEKQAIKITEDIPRIRKTHKGDEIVGDDLSMTIDEVPSAPVPRQPTRERSSVDQKSPVLPSPHDHSNSPAQGLVVDTQQSPNRSDFDINKVFSSVKSPTQTTHHQRPSLSAAPPGGPGVDPDVDRLLDDGTQSPPYSPKVEEPLRPGEVWRGDLNMSSIGSVHVTAKHAGGANLVETIGLPWDQLIPKTMSVCGRIEVQSAMVYLCSMRYAAGTDVVVTSMEPASEEMRPTFNQIVDYFLAKDRYGVIGDKGVANVRDTYLVPVPAGTGNYPEFMLNLIDNYIPNNRPNPILLGVFIYRVDQEVMKRLEAERAASAAEVENALRLQSLAQQQHAYSQSPATPTPGQTGFPQQGRPSISGPAFSPTSPQVTYPPYGTPQNNGMMQPAPAHPSSFHPSNDEAQLAAEAVAREVLGSYITSPTVSFLLPQAQEMTRREWEVILKIYQRDPLTCEDLPHLSSVLEKEGKEEEKEGGLDEEIDQKHMPAPRAEAGVEKTESSSEDKPMTDRAVPLAPESNPVTAPTPASRRKAQVPATETPVPPPQHPHVIRNTPIPPPPIPPIATPSTLPRQTPPRQTPIPPPPIPPQAAAAGAPPA